MNPPRRLQEQGAMSNLFADSKAAKVALARKRAGNTEVSRDLRAELAAAHGVDGRRRAAGCPKGPAALEMGITCSTRNFRNNGKHSLFFC